LRKGFVQNRIVETVDGVEVSPMKVTGETEKRGTEVHFLPDTDIFQQNNDFHYEILQAPARAELPEQRRAHPPEGRAHRQGRRLCRRRRRQGLCGLHQQGQEGVLHPNVFHAIGDRQSDQGTNIGVEVAMQWNSGYNEQVLCFTNNIPQRDGGTHLTGLRAAMTRVINKYIERTSWPRRPRSR
jgi:DNA gyrase subunit B